MSFPLKRRRYIKDMAAEGTWGDELTLVRCIEAECCLAFRGKWLQW